MKTTTYRFPAESEIPKKIKYTIPADCETPQLRNKECWGGVPRRLNGMKVVFFSNLIDGHQIFAKLEGNAELQRLVDEYKAQPGVTSREERDSLRIVCPVLLC